MTAEGRRDREYILALDQGTTSTRAMIFTEQGRIAARDQSDFKQFYPRPGWVEHDPEEIWDSTRRVIKGALEKGGIIPAQIKAIGITNQRETTLIWDRRTGRAVHRAIVWQCRRSTEVCRELKEAGLEERFREKTGLVLDPYFSGTKIKWLLENVQGLRARAERGELAFGTVDSWLLWKLSGGELHLTDYSNASRTLLFNIHTLEWDEELLELLDIPAKLLPEVRSSSEIYGCTAPGLFEGERTALAGVAGDQQAATFGQGCFSPGMAKITYGTGGFLLMNTGLEAVSSDNGLLTTIAWGIKDKIEYALEGSIFIAGAAVQWLRDELGIIQQAADSESLARQVEDTRGVYVVPAFTGLGAPYWEPEARGTIVGLTRECNKSHLVRAVLESLAYQSRDVLEAMAADAGIRLQEIRVDGGAAVNKLLLQFLADITGTAVERPVVTETTAAGAAYLAGLAVGFWKDKNELLKTIAVDRNFTPVMGAEQREQLYSGWQRAVAAVLGWSRRA